jgi:hypothetical protein
MSLTAEEVFKNTDGSYRMLPTEQQIPWHASYYYFSFDQNEWFILWKMLFQVWWLFSYVYPNEYWFNYVFGDKWDSFFDMIADGWVLLNYVMYLFFYELYRRMVYLVGFEILAALCSPFYYVFAWSYVFNHQAWEL